MLRNTTPSVDAEVERTPVNSVQFKDALGHFCTGVTVIASVVNGAPRGFSVQSFLSLSINPPLVAFCPARASSTWPQLRTAGVFCATVLAADQEELCRRFATSGADKFGHTQWHAGPATGSPIIDGGLAWTDCQLESEHDAGDHTIAVGRVLAVGAPGGRDPLLFYRASFVELGSSGPAGPAP